MERHTNAPRRFASANEGLASNRPRHNTAYKNKAAQKTRGRGMLFLKQCLAALIIAAAYILINKSGITLGKNCLAALGRAVRWEVSFSDISSAVLSFANNIAAFFADVF